MKINKFNVCEAPPLNEADNMKEIKKWVDQYGVMNLSNENYVAWIDHQIYLNKVNAEIRPEEADKLFVGQENNNQHLITRYDFEQPLDKFKLPKAVKTLVILFWLTVAVVAGFMQSDAFLFWTYWFWARLIIGVVARYFSNDYLTCHHLKMMRQRMQDTLPSDSYLY